MLCSACLDSALDVEASTAAVQGPKAITVLAFVNDQQAATLAFLDHDCALRADAARNIIAHRDGVDGVVATPDDNLFDDLDELDGVFRVGDKTISQIALCAGELGYGPTDEDLMLFNFLNDAANTTFELLDDDCALRSDAAANLIAHRDGADGLAGTADDNAFHSAAEVDGVARVGSWTMSQLYACADALEYGAPTFGWRPEVPECSAYAENATLVVSEADCVFTIDDADGPAQGAAFTLYDEHEMRHTRVPVGWFSSGVSRAVPAGYGADHVAQDGTATTFRITRDPAGTLTVDAALDIARRELEVFLREDRIHRPDWQAEGPRTWEACLAKGIMEGIYGYGDPEFSEDFGFSRGVSEYSFSGRGPLRLYTVIKVSKATREVTTIYVEID